jgi:alkylhydroperoxidase family enzyme
MARIFYPDLDQPDIAPVAARIKAERGKVLKLYHMLLHSPPIADGWRALFTAVRQQCSLPGRIRELVILRIAVINKADYEFDAHRPFALREGLTERDIDALRAGRRDEFEARERAVLEYAESMTRDVQVPDAIFAAVRRHFNERELVELTVTVAGYNLVSRVLEALQVDHE